MTNIQLRQSALSNGEIVTLQIFLQGMEACPEEASGKKYKF